MRIKSILVPAAFVLAMASSPSWAGGTGGLLGGLGGAVGGVVGGLSSAVGGTVGGVTKGVGDTLSGVTGGASTGVTADISAGTSLDRAAMDRKISARLALLSNRKLLQLCASAGGKGCESASRSQRISLIDARLGVLSSKELLGLCVSVGDSCGGPAKTAVGTNVPKTVAGGHQERAEAAICPPARRITKNGKAYCLMPLPQ